MILARLVILKCMITDIEEYFAKGCGRCNRFATPDCSTRKWLRGLIDLRRICLAAGLDETVKWGHPCYMHRARNIVVLGATREDIRISFFNAALMKDPEGILEASGPHTPVPDMIRFTDSSYVAQQEPIITAYLREAMDYAAAGIKPPKTTHALELPPELEEAMGSDLELAAAFARLTPGRQRSYVINLSSAKKPETRVARIAKFRDKILAGKGALDP